MGDRAQRRVASNLIRLVLTRRSQRVVPVAGSNVAEGGGRGDEEG